MGPVGGERTVGSALALQKIFEFPVTPVRLTVTRSFPPARMELVLSALGVVPEDPSGIMQGVQVTVPESVGLLNVPLVIVGLVANTRFPVPVLVQLDAMGTAVPPLLLHSAVLLAIVESPMVPVPLVMVGGAVVIPPLVVPVRLVEVVACDQVPGVPAVVQTRYWRDWRRRSAYSFRPLSYSYPAHWEIRFLGETCWCCQRPRNPTIRLWMTCDRPERSSSSPCQNAVYRSG
jgi:hypothetical protein